MEWSDRYENQFERAAPYPTFAVETMLLARLVKPGSLSSSTRRTPANSSSSGGVGTTADRSS